MSEYKEPMELDAAYKVADALYAAGYKDRHNERDYDPRKCLEWQAVVDPLIEQAAPEAAASKQQHLLSDILTLATQGMCHGLLADDYCSQIVAKIKGEATAASASEPINTDGMSDGKIYAEVSRRALAPTRNAEPASTATAKPAYTRTDAMLAFSAMCDTSLITRTAAEAMRDTLCAAVEAPAPGQQAPVAQPDRTADTMDHAQLQALGRHRGPP